MRTGLDRNTGEVLEGWDECAQSIGVIGSTAILSLVLNRPFGSDCPDLVDKPGNAKSVGRYFTAIGRALRKWEPGFKLTRVHLRALTPGLAEFQISGIFYPNGHLGDYSNPQGVSAMVSTIGLISVRA
jgi:phage baseplate assembly protein W